MNTLIIYAHPWEKSFNHAILDSVVKGLISSDHHYKIIDLYGENFNPTFKKEELALYNKGEYIDPKVGQFQEMINGSDQMIFIFPIWWGFAPSILKGFIDKVFLKNWAYDLNGSKVIKKLVFIKKTTIITTMNSPRIFYLLFIKWVLKILFGLNFLKLCGVKKVEYIVLCSIRKISNAKREKFLKKVEKYVQY